MEALQRRLATREDEDQDINRLRRELRELEDIIREKNESLEQAASLEAELEEARAIAHEREAALEEIDDRHRADLAELDGQWRSSLVQAEEKIQILEDDCSDMEQQLKQAADQLAEKIMETEALNQELQQVRIASTILQKTF